MSDEIDIEEHDVMDNPSIKRIFPDLSVIKKEINHYYDEDLSALPENTFTESSQGIANKSDFKNQDNTDMLISKERIFGTYFNIPKVIDPPKELGYLYENIIILGTKPNVECRKKNYTGMKKREPKLIIKNISTFLNNCKRYCKDCHILFPKANILNLHIYNVHTLKRENMNSNSRDFYKIYNCNTCNTSFSSRFSLIRHLKQAHGKFGTNNSNNKNGLHENSKNELGKGHVCFHCQQLFLTQNSLIEHLYDVMKPKSIENKRNSSSSKSSTIAKEENLIDHPNENDCCKHLEVFNNVSESKCKSQFASLENMYQHNRDNQVICKKHNSQSDNVSKSGSSNSVAGSSEYDENVKKIYNIDPKQQEHTSDDDMKMKTNKCIKCSKEFGSNGELEYHFMSIHKKQSLIEKTKMKKESVENINKSNNQLTGMLYQCFICSKYNLTIKYYWRHMINNHNLKEVTKVKKVLFDSQCKFCTSKLSNMKYYNVHINKYHKMLLKKAIDPREKQEIKRNSHRINVNESKCKSQSPSLENMYQYKSNNQVNYKKYNSKSDNVSMSGSSNSVSGSSEYDENVKKICNKDPKQQEHTNDDDMRMKTNKCIKCLEEFGSNWELEYHFMSIHKKQSLIEKTKMKKESVENINKSNNQLTGMLYQCFICSKYNLTIKFYWRHMINNHNLKVVTKVKKVLFDSQCKFCTSKLSNMKYYNVHINKYHKMLLRKAIVPHEKQEIKRNSHRLNFIESKCKSQSASLENIYQHNRDNQVICKKHNSQSDNVSMSGSSNSVSGSSEYDENVKKICNKDPKQQEHTNDDDMRMKTNKCKKCSVEFGSKGELEYHFMSIHKKQSLIEKTKMKKESVENINKSNNQLTGMLYQCFICSKYNLTIKYYWRHMINNHNLKEVTKVKKVLFDSQCKFCTSKLSNMKYYNVHINKYHKMLLRKAIVPREKQEIKRNIRRLNKEFHFALNSILYQCTKCDIFFLSADAARSHLEHTKTLDTWKCSVCQRIFKKKDKALHLKQHSFSQTFTVYTLSESAFSRILYKCSKCTIHYSEEQYSLHYTKCDTETPDSLYCKCCDILINRNDMDFHELNHRDKKIVFSDFTIIESEILDRVSPNIEIGESHTLQKSMFAMTFCHTCKCFVSNIQMTHNVHTEARCGHMLKTVCEDCGLLLTMKSHSTHKKIHKKKKVNLQHYFFYDLKTRKQILPPIPDFPSCQSCGVHFLRKSAILVHSCNEQDFMTCNICLTKFTEHAYKLHMAYHNYSIQKENKKMKDTEHELRSTNDIISYTDPNSCRLDDFTFADLFLYTCKGCHITLNTYDGVIQHCQDHYYCKDIALNTQKCQYCILTFGSKDYDIHNKLHSNGKYNKDSVTVVEFDPFYFCYNNDFWTKHIFAYVADEQIRKILDASIYKYECRLKMEELQSGSLSMTFYKCAKCQVYIEPHSLYLHVENSRGTSCPKLRKHPCSFCGLSFLSGIYRMAHEKEHQGKDINLKSYKIILFNKIEHETFNNIMFEASNRYILYQCRNCEQVVDKFQRKCHKCDVNYLKICPACGLLIHKHDYDLHFIRHEELDNFKTENMIVIMFGKLLYIRKKELRSTFSGTKYDYTIYKCNKCEICLGTKLCTSKHICVFENSKCKCTKCGLYFSKPDLKYHSKQHDSGLEFDEYNINIITFDSSSPKHVPKEPLDENNETQKEIEQAGDKNALDIEKNSNCSEKLERIYKCGCGLHFLEELNGQRHAKNCNAKMKISKQSCFKCDLLFTPGELFNHLLIHHCDKKLQYKFDIVNIM